MIASRENDMWRILRIFYSREVLADIFLIGITLSLLDKNILESRGDIPFKFSLKGKLLYKLMRWLRFSPTQAEYDDFFNRYFKKEGQ